MLFMLLVPFVVPSSVTQCSILPNSRSPFSLTRGKGFLFLRWPPRGEVALVARSDALLHGLATVATHALPHLRIIFFAEVDGTRAVIATVRVLVTLLATQTIAPDRNPLVDSLPKWQGEGNMQQERQGPQPNGLPRQIPDRCGPAVALLLLIHQHHFGHETLMTQVGIVP